MQNIKNKTMAIIITLILASSMALSIGAIQTTKADVINGVNYDKQTTDLINAGMTWAGMPYNISAYPNRLLLWNRFHDQISTWTFGITSPNPVGVGQTFNLIMMNPQVPPNSLLTNNIRYTFKISILKPDGTTENLPATGQTGGNVAAGQGGISGDHFVSDSTGSTYTAYTPDQVGNYSITVYFQQLQYLWNTTNGGGDNNYYGTTFKASNYTVIVSVQQDPVQINGEPIIQSVPTEYWSRPIEGQNDQWYTVSSNWLSGSHDRDNGGGENRYQADGTAPNSPHILWTRPTEDNGIVGGANLSRTGSGNSFNAGSQYQPRWTNQVIMFGRLYYSPNALASGSSSYMDCVDLKTGELLWERNTGADQSNTGGLGVSTTANMFSFGYYYSQDDPNEHGVQNPGWLFSSNYAIGYQPERGFPWLNITNVPSGFELNAPEGENLRYVITNLGTTANPIYYLSEWNSSKVVPMIASGGNPTNLDIIANVPLSPAPANTYWNGTAWAPAVITVTTIPGYGTFTSSGPPAILGLATPTGPSYDYNVSLPYFATTPTIRAGVVGDFIWGSNGTWATGTSGPSYYYPSEVTVWKISLKPQTFGNITFMANITIDDPITNQNNMFERASGSEHRFVTIEVPSCTFHIYNMDNGQEIAKTDAQADLQAYGYFTWPSLISQTQTKMAHGILYTGGYTGAVSAYSLANGSLLWRNVYPSGGEKIPNFVQMIGLIADGKIYVGTHEHSADTPLYKGERIHALNATTGETIWDMSGWAYPMTFATADGVMVYWNNYDAQIYAIGKGPTAMTVTAPDTASQLGSSITIKGTILDVSAGTKQDQQAARFPYGVPAVSDAAQAQWMEYVYMQKGKPTNTTGVPITLSVVDSNGNFKDIGTTVSNDGFFSLNWKPDITGQYTVYASFAGSESYWPTHAVTAFSVDPAAATPEPQLQTTLPPFETYILAGVIAMIIAIAVVGVVILLAVRKRA
jgi:hypothetical protein